MSADDRYEQENDQVAAGDITDDTPNDAYAEKGSGVVKDDAPVDDPIDPATADSDEMLGM
jgi:hypothetical protein